MAKSHSDLAEVFPSQPIDRLTAPLTRFLHIESAAGFVLLACTFLALVAANSSMADGYLEFWKTPVGLELGSVRIVHSLKHWVNDALMAIFFFVIGLEVKREIVLGELRDLRRAALPIAGALGGMVAPAAVYLAMQYGQPAARGWGIPMATDIAFVVGCMAILGPRVPHGLRVMLLSLAIADDIGAILVIAVGYTESLQFGWLAAGAVLLGLVWLCAALGVRHLLVYFVLGAFVWFSFHESGVHATIAGVILGLMTPARSYLDKSRFQRVLQATSDLLTGEGWHTAAHAAERVRSVRVAARETISPLEYLESTLHPWVSFGIMPLFALANAGVPFELADLTAPVAVAVVAGLVIGKPAGILLASWLAVMVGMAKLPQGVTWGMVLAGGCLAGIGFTMALFIAGLALQGEALTTAKIGVLGGSALSAVLGMSLLRLQPQPPSQPSTSQPAS